MAHNLSDIEEAILPTDEGEWQLAANNRRRKDIYRLPQADQQLLETLGYKQKLDQVDDAIRANAELLSLIVANPEIFGHGLEPEEDGDGPLTPTPILTLGRIHTRTLCMSMANRMAPTGDSAESTDQQISTWISFEAPSNSSSETGANSFSNVHSRQAMLQAISIPDVLPSALPPGSNFSLVAGDFEEIYGVDTDPEEPQAGEWDAILTCFFIDTVGASHPT
ncbi:hypothetical protein DXG01_004871 [Tephrocybe rancida]|nr:hypothetical protein DXG01_004871 [Tephrocybe rancida]